MLVTEDPRGRRHELELGFTWDPHPLPLPLDLRDVGRFQDIQEIGQPINGAFDLDRAQNLIRSRAGRPRRVPDPGLAARERGGDLCRAFSGASGVEVARPCRLHGRTGGGVPPRGLKVGWSSASMAALSPKGEARSFIAWGDHSGRPEEWAIATHPPAEVRIEKGRLYRVRHQVCFANGIDRVRFHVWPVDLPEPDGWLCSEQDDRVPAGLPRHRRASFGLFEHLGIRSSGRTP